MEKGRFNLVDEPWIPVVDREMRHRRVSLREALLSADGLLAIDGEMPLQSVALLRLLLAVVITILERCDENGREAEPEEPPQAARRWLAVYRRGKLPEAAVDTYLDKWHDRFWLLGGERPFFQVRPEEVRFAEKSGNGPDNRTLVLRRADGEPEHIPDFDEVCACTWNTAAQLNGSISESANKPSAVAERRGYWKEHLTPAEAAAWLVYTMSFATCGSCGKGNDTDKSKKNVHDGSSLRSAEITAASQGCLVYADGDTLLKTLLLNAPLARRVPGGWEMYGPPRPAWEDEREYLMKERRPVPEDLPGLMTQQSRRVLLHQDEEGYIDGFYMGMGDTWTDRGREPMFMWQPYRDKETKELSVRPVHYKEQTLEWQNCEYLFGGRTDARTAVAEWAAARMEDLENDSPLLFRMADISYGTMNSVVNRTTSGFLRIAPAFFEDDGLLAGEAETALRHIDEYAKVMYALGRNLGVAEGMDEKSAAAANARRVKAAYYDRIGPWFMRFLVQDGISAGELAEAEYNEAKKLCEEEAAKAPPEAIHGHGGEDAMTMGRAYGICRGKLGKLRKGLKGD